MDAFKLLTKSGTSFDSKKFKSDIDLFNNKYRGSGKRNISDHDNSAFVLTNHLPKDLDFFGDNSHSKKNLNDKGKSKDVSQLIGDSIDNSVDYTPPSAGEVIHLRKSLQLNVAGEDVPPPLRSLSELKSLCKFPDYLLRNLSFLNSLTSIQSQAIPLTLNDRDLLAIAPTGSGKTLAYLLPLLKVLDVPKKEGFRALIICPTRELSQQIRNELARISFGRRWKVSILSKATSATMKSDPSTKSKHDILISTPLRLKYAIETEEIDLSNVRHLILDEGDRLLDMGFLDQVDTIISACSHPNIRKSLFTATLPASVEDISKNILRLPVRVIVGKKDATSSEVKQDLMYVGREDGKMLAIRQLVQSGEFKPPVLIFVQTVERANELFNELVYDNIRVDVIHGERTPAQRDEVIKQFRKGDVWVLIATDVLARGIDVQAINVVINYDFPQSPASYVHRVGRTGRAGRIGKAITFFTNDDVPYLKSVVNVMKSSGCEVPDWMLKLKKPNSNMRKTLKKRPLGRESVHESTGTKFGIDEVKKHKDMVNASKRRKLSKKDNDSNKDHSNDNNE